MVFGMTAVRAEGHGNTFSFSMAFQDVCKYFSLFITKLFENKIAILDFIRYDLSEVMSRIIFRHYYHLPNLHKVIRAQPDLLRLSGYTWL